MINGPRFRGVRNQLDRLKLQMLKPAAMKLVNREELQSDRIANFDILPGEVGSLWTDHFFNALKNHIPMYSESRYIQ